MPGRVIFQRKISNRTYGAMPRNTVAEARPPTEDYNDERDVEIRSQISAWKDIKFRNVILLGFSFMVLFAAFQTCGVIQTIVLKSYFGDDASTLGYNSLATLYAVLAVANWFSPYIASLVGPKWGMIGGGLCYSLFISIFLRPYYWTLFLGSVIVGVGAAVLWTSQGMFLTVNSDKQTMARNSGLFWALFQSSYVVGNLFFFLYLRGQSDISDQSRTVIYSVLLSLSVAGIVIMLFFKNPVVGHIAEESVLPVNDRSESVPARKNPLKSVADAFRLFKGKDMLLLSVTFAYTGFEQTFYSGVYGTSLGYTTDFGDVRKSIVGLSGVAIGVGEIVGGLAFGILGKRTIRHGRDPIIIFGYLLHLCTFFLIFLTIPADAPLRESVLPAYITPNVYLGIFCCFLLGLGDASFNTQIYSLIGDIFRTNCASAFAIFKFVQSLCAAGGFFYSSYLLMHYQLLILVITGALGSFSFCFVEWKHAADGLEVVKPV